MSICAITFDFWGTLFRDARGEERHQLRVKALVEATGVSRDAADKALRDAMAYFLQQHIATQHTLTPMDAVEIVCAALRVPIPHEAAYSLARVFADVVLEYPPEPIEDALEAVREASARVPVAIISDTGFSPGRNLRILMEREGFTPYFTATTFSDEMGVAKPQLPMFETTARQLGVASHELLHIGDLEPTDIIGAHQAGGKGGLFTAVNNRFAETTTADYIFSCWQDFIEMLPQLV
ncbi:MAG TPA: HAD family hydrolase [Candidatus Hydrogenedentes bacterium]|nr:HAD family hydrolase [Candidatus Hydrogenedentota bacterium]